MTLPLVLLAIPSVLVGYFTITPMVFGDFFGDAIVINAAIHPAIAEFTKIFHGPMGMALHAFSTPPLYLAAAGVALSYYMYMVNPALPAAIVEKQGLAQVSDTGAIEKLAAEVIAAHPGRWEPGAVAQARSMRLDADSDPGEAWWMQVLDAADTGLRVALAKLPDRKVDPLEGL